MRRRRSARWSYRVLLGILLLSLLTPLLPLAAPDRIDPTLAHQPPQWTGTSGFWLAEGTLDTLHRERLWPWDRGLVSAREVIWGTRAVPPLCGRDALGRCLLSRLCWGARVSLAVGVCAALVSLVVGVLYGSFAGFVGGRVDAVMMRIVDMLYGIPFIFVVIFLITMLRSRAEAAGVRSVQLLVFFLVIGFVYWLTMARVVRGQVVALREQEFVTAARALGGAVPGLLFRHILPNLSSVIIVTLTLTVPRVLLFESFISFLGLGVQAPAVSWGILMRESFEVLNPLSVPWWLVLAPSLCLALTLGALNHLGDCLRDAFDPRLRGC